MAKNSECQTQPVDNEKLLKLALEELETMAREAFQNRSFHGTVRIELGIKHGQAAFVRKCPDQTFTPATLN